MHFRVQFATYKHINVTKLGRNKHEFQGKRTKLKLMDGLHHLSKVGSFHRNRLCSKKDPTSSLPKNNVNNVAPSKLAYVKPDNALYTSSLFIFLIIFQRQLVEASDGSCNEIG